MVNTGGGTMHKHRGPQPPVQSEQGSVLAQRNACAKHTKPCMQLTRVHTIKANSSSASKGHPRTPTTPAEQSSRANKAEPPYTRADNERSRRKQHTRETSNTYITGAHQKATPKRNTSNTHKPPTHYTRYVEQHISISPAISTTGRWPALIQSQQHTRPRVLTAL